MGFLKEASESFTQSPRRLREAGAPRGGGREQRRKIEGVRPSDSRWVCEGRGWQMLLSAFQQSPLCGSSADASSPFSLHALSSLSSLHPPPSLPLPLDRLWCGDNKTGAVLSAVKWPHWHGATCGRGRGWGDGEVQAWAQGLRRSQRRGGGGFINVGVSAWGQGKGSPLWAVGTSWDMGSVAVLPVRKADVFTRGCAKFAEQPSAAWRSGL